MKTNITLSTGRVISHRPYGNGATEAFVLSGGNMTDKEWIEYVQLTQPKPKPKKPTWAEIKAFNRAQLSQGV